LNYTRGSEPIVFVAADRVAPYSPTAAPCLLCSGRHTRSARKMDWFVNSSAPNNPASPRGHWRFELVNLIDHRHELVRLGDLIDWQAFADECSAQFAPPPGALRCPRV